MWSKTKAFHEVRRTNSSARNLNSQNFVTEVTRVRVGQPHPDRRARVAPSASRRTPRAARRTQPRSPSFAHGYGLIHARRMMRRLAWGLHALSHHGGAARRGTAHRYRAVARRRSRQRDGSGSVSGRAAAPSGQTLDRAAGAVVCLVNAERTRHGLRALRADGDLRQAAGRHSRNMVRRGFFSHVTPDGADVSDRLRRSGYLVHGRRRRDPRLGHGYALVPDQHRCRVDREPAAPSHPARAPLARRRRGCRRGHSAGDPGGRRGATYTLDTGVRAAAVGSASSHPAYLSKELI